MEEPLPTPSAAARSPRGRSLPTPGPRRATVIGAGSFGTALAVLLTRAGVRTTLQTRTAEQAAELESKRENVAYLPGVALPGALRVEAASAGAARADFVFLAVPSRAIGEAIDGLVAAGLGRRTAVVSVAKGLVPPAGTAPTVVLSERFGAERVACLGGPAHAQEMVDSGAALVAASTDEELARTVAQLFIRAGVVCEQSNDPIGVELAGAAKNAAALAAGATEAQGLNAAGAADLGRAAVGGLGRPGQGDGAAAGALAPTPAAGLLAAPVAAALRRRRLTQASRPAISVPTTAS